MKIFLFIASTLYLATGTSAQATIFTGCSATPLVFCNNVATSFEARVTNTNGAITLATFTGKTAATFPDTYFQNLTIESMISTNNSITTIGDNVFTGATITTLSFAEPSLLTTTTNSFAPLAASLTSLSFQSSGITPARMNGIATGMATLANLRSLSLSNNSLITISLAWFSGLNALQTLDLTGNQLTDTASVFTALSTVSDTLTTLILAGNQIASLSALPSMPALQTLRLESNLIATLATTNPFANAAALSTIGLSGNRLTSVPSIASQTALLSFDISSQNGALLKIANNAFSRSSTPSAFAVVNLDLNTGLNYSELAFCSSAANQYSSITVPGSSVSNINVCHMAQLGGTVGNPVQLIVSSVAGVDFSTFCNCTTYQASKEFNVNILNALSVCSTFTNLTDAACASTVFSNTCATSVFACATTTSSSTMIRFDLIGFLLTNIVFIFTFKQF